MGYGIADKANLFHDSSPSPLHTATIALRTTGASISLYTSTCPIWLASTHRVRPARTFLSRCMAFMMASISTPEQRIGRPNARRKQARISCLPGSNVLFKYAKQVSIHDDGILDDLCPAFAIDTLWQGQEKRGIDVDQLRLIESSNKVFP